MSVNISEYTIDKIAQIINGKLIQQKTKLAIENILLDSRRLVFPATTIYFSLAGPTRNGNLFIPELYQKGVRNFVVDQSVDSSLLNICTEANFLQVENPRASLQMLAAYHRNSFAYPVIGITGSNGKTIIKEWLYQLLNSHYNIVRSPKSYNSQVGVPLSIWQMSPNHTLGIFEAGISQIEEMQHLQKIINPTIGVLGFIGDAHSEGFQSISEKVLEKCILFTNSHVLIYCSENKVVHDAIHSFTKTINTSMQLFTWSRNHEANLFISNISKQNHSAEIHCIYNHIDFSFTIPFSDDASIYNAITCCATMLYLKQSISEISIKMNELRPLAMRLELIEGINQCSIINDSYSADMESLKIALTFLEQQDLNTKKTLILSDMMQIGLAENLLYTQLSKLIQEKKLYRFIGIGPSMIANQKLFDKIENKQFYSSTAEFLSSSNHLQFKNETILLKGARVFEFEKINRALEQKIHDTILEINLTAIRSNLKTYKQQLKKGVKLMCMVKAFSYGSGSYEIASVLQHEGVDYLAVAYADEGVELRQAGIHLPIMVMNATIDSFSTLLQYNLEPELYSIKILEAFKNYLDQSKTKNYPVHLKLDTGMHRLGFVDSDLQKLCNYLKNNDSMKIVSVFSHLVSSDDALSDAFTMTQSYLFHEMTDEIKKVVPYTFIKHLSNTAAIKRHNSLQLDMVRLGIGLYGIDNNLTLQNVTTLKTTIAQIKSVKKGETVGYGRTGLLDKDATIATVRIGYADGYSRSLSNGVGKMLVNGQLASVVGKVCMDMTMLDISGINAQEGDEVIVFGEQLPVKHIADWSNTISYEVLTNISQRVKRVYFEE